MNSPTAIPPTWHGDAMDKEQNKDGANRKGNTYRAIEVTRPGALNLVQRLLSEPGPGQVRLRVEACGICHSDAATVDGGFPGIRYPRVPGHEVVGRIDALGSGVQGWAVGQRVG